MFLYIVIKCNNGKYLRENPKYKGELLSDGKKEEKYSQWKINNMFKDGTANIKNVGTGRYLAYDKGRQQFHLIQKDRLEYDPLTHFKLIHDRPTNYCKLESNS